MWRWLEPSPPRPKIGLCCVVGCERAVGEDAVAAEIPMLALRLPARVIRVWTIDGRIDEATVRQYRARVAEAITDMTRRGLFSVCLAGYI